MSFPSLAKIFRKKNKMLAEAFIESEEVSMPMSFSSRFKKRLLSISNNKQVFIGGSFLVIATFLANILNYIFNAYLGRVLTFEDFSLIGLIGGLYSFASIFFGAYSTIVNYRSGFLIGKYGDAAGYEFWKYIKKQILYPAIILTILWLIAIPFLMSFFHTNNLLLFVLFSFVLLVGFTSNINQGFLFSRMMFGSLAILSLADPLVKLITTLILVIIGLKIWAFSAIPASVLIVFAVGWFLIAKQVPQQKTTAPLSEVHSYSKKFFFVSLLTSFSTIAYFTFDIFLAKHFLTPDQAGEYALLSLVGKMIFFIGNLTSPFIIPLISRYEGAKKNSLHALYAILGLTAFFVFCGFILVGVFGQFTVPLLYGEKARVIVPYVSYFTFGMACYTISSVLVNYYLVRKIYLFTVVSSLLIILQIVLLALFHTSVQSFAIAMSVALAANLIVTMSLHLGLKKIQTFGKYFKALSVSEDK
ncbi:MAG TPA: oligosaccharide flippase family protein [Candidatus Saccharimonadales bacterium]|nr:oligosaccharide flippase family protein [Candidatus Saccharimonadales bacterium]